MSNETLSEVGLERLERLARLREAGALTDAEFEEQKRALLTPGTPPQPRSDNIAKGTPPSSRRPWPRTFFWLGGGIATLAGLVLLWANRPGASPASPTNHSGAAISTSGKGGDPVVPQVAQTTSRASSPAHGNRPAVFPREYRGLWGTSADSCAGRDDYGPMVVTANGFNLYEAYGTLAQAPRQVGARTIEVRFLPEEEQPNPPRERWTLNADGSLTRMDMKFRRCPPGTRSPF